MRTREEIECALRAENLTYECLETDDGGWALVVAELGAKVLAAGVDRECLFWVSTSLKKGAWCVGGQRTWLAPELGDRGFFGTGAEDWRVPPQLDPGSYRRIESSNGELAWRCDLAVDRLDGRSFALGIVRSFRVESVSVGASNPALEIRVGNRLINRMDRILEEEVGLWNIIQAPAQRTGTFLIPLKSSSPPQPGGKARRLYFGDLPTDWVSETPNLLYVRAQAGKLFKIGVPPAAAAGMLGYLYPSRVDDAHILTILRTDVEPSARYVDKPPHQPVENGDALQCYNSPDQRKLNFCELEAHAPAAALGPGAEQSAHIAILLFKARPDELRHVAGQLLSRVVDTERLFLD